MGFLSANRPRKRRRQNQKTEHVNASRVSLKLPDLPVEILGHIFALSQNLDLPRSCARLHNILGQSAWLRYEVAKSFVDIVDEVRRFPVAICTRRFVTAKILKDLDIEEFWDESSTNVMIPSMLEEDLNDRKYSVIKYLLSKKCVSRRTSQAVFSAAISNHWDLVRDLVELGAHHDLRSAIMALSAGKAELAAQMARGAEVTEDIWEYVVGTRKTQAVDFLRDHGHPPPAWVFGLV